MSKVDSRTHKPSYHFCNYFRLRKVLDCIRTSRSLKVSCPLLNTYVVDSFLTNFSENLPIKYVTNRDDVSVSILFTNISLFIHHYCI